MADRTYRLMWYPDYGEGLLLSASTIFSL